MVGGRQLEIIATCDNSKGLFCSVNNRCNCTRGNRWYVDSVRRNFTCVPRRYGDSCDFDEDCFKIGTYTENNANGGAKCISGRCVCNPDTHTRTDVLRVESISFVDGSNNYVATPICLRRSRYHQYVNLKPGANCTINPWNESSYGGYVRACAADSICVQCPGDFWPTCQRPLKLDWEIATPEPLPGVPTAFRRFFLVLQNLFIFITFSTALQYVQRTIGPIYENKVVLPWFHNDIGGESVCRSDRDCFSRGQGCAISGAFSPPCQQGTCRCPDGQLPVSGSCQSLRKIQLFMPCSMDIRLNYNITSTEVYPIGAICRGGRVECANSATELQRAIDLRMKSRMLSIATDDSSCFYIKSLGESCSTVNDLCNPIQGLECSSDLKVCHCSSGSFDSTIQRCRYS